jgi:hypothetical protein
MFARFAALALMLVGALPLAAPAAASEIVLDAASGHIVLTRINGHQVRLRVDPETSGFIILNGEAAQRIGLRPSMIGVSTDIGPVRVFGNTKVARVSVAGSREGNRRLAWTNRVAAAGADGLIGPADMPFDKVVLGLREPVDGEQSVELPMEFKRSPGLFHSVNIAGTAVSFLISTTRPDSISTAAAGALLAERHGGAWSGEPGEQMIKYEVVRPVRPLLLSAPVEIAGLPLRRILVRTGDHRAAWRSRQTRSPIRMRSW